MYNLEDYEKLKNQSVEMPKKKFFSKKIGMILGVFVLTVVIVGASLASMLNDLGNSIGKFKGYLGYLFEEYNVSEIVTDPIYAESYSKFEGKAYYHGFNFTNNGKVDLEREDLKINSTARFTDKEYGAFLTKALNSTDSEINNLITVSQFTVAKNDEGLVTLKVVYKFDLTSVKSMLQLTLGNVPTNIYITVTTKMVGEVFALNTIKVNNLSDEKNQDVLLLINEIFGSKDDVTFADTLANLVFNLNKNLSEKLDIEIVYNNNEVRFEVR